MPVFFIKKNDSLSQLVQDYRTSNSMMIINKYLLLLIFEYASVRVESDGFYFISFLIFIFFPFYFILGFKVSVYMKLYITITNYHKLVTVTHSHNHVS